MGVPKSSDNYSFAPVISALILYPSHWGTGQPQCSTYHHPRCTHRLYFEMLLGHFYVPFGQIEH